MGVDVVLDTSGYARVIRCYDGSPAAQAGVAKNWFITKIGDSDVKRLSLTQINSLLRGEGTTVTPDGAQSPPVKSRPSRSSAAPTTCPPSPIRCPEGKTTGYIQIYQFNSNTASEVQTAIETMQASTQLQALVFDMRNTSGGELDDVMDVIDLLCPVGPIASQQNKDGTVTVLDTSDSKRGRPAHGRAGQRQHLPHRRTVRRVPA